MAMVTPVETAHRQKELQMSAPGGDGNRGANWSSSNENSGLKKGECSMSTDYRPLKTIRSCDLFDGRLGKFNVYEHFKPGETTETKRCLTDGRNYVWVHIADDGFVCCLTRYFPNGAPGKILNALAEVFNSDIVSEYEPQFWGFDTQEEWDACWEKIAKEHKEDEERFHFEILKYCKGESNDIRPGSIGMLKAEIAKRLGEKDPTLLLPINKDKLRNEIQSVYNRDHAAVPF